MKLFSGIECKILQDINLDKKYNGMEYDSRKIKKDDIFVALVGATVDGHDYIDEAVKRGASCIIVSREIELKHKDVSYVLVENLRPKLSQIASNFYEWPQKKLTLIGVTGTNGKTSSTYMIEKLLGEEQITRIGTIEYKIGNETYDAVNTTPESLDLIKIFHKSLEKGIKYVVMEVSSHSLELGRVETLDFDYALFTNLTQDHLDYHINMENYFLAKRKLFLKLKNKKNAVINVDDAYGKRLYDEFSKDEDVLSYGMKDGKLKASFEKKGKIKISYQNLNEETKYGLLGNFNLYNTLGAVGIVLKIGVKIQDVLKRIETLRPAPGRFENMDCGQDYKVLIDYAHTPDALENVIIAARTIPNANRIITLFGCGGDRDRTKRPIMAKIAEKNSDIVILTSDNPRTEDPKQIFTDVKVGFSEESNYFFFEDREEAIKKAINIAEKNDIILITGKGHETYQILGRKKIHFDDREISRREIVRRKMVENDNK